MIILDTVSVVRGEDPKYVMVTFHIYKEKSGSYQHRRIDLTDDCFDEYGEPDDDMIREVALEELKELYLP